MSELALSHRGTFGDPRPAELATLPLPPDAMPSRQRLRPLKAWRYVGVYGADLMLCVGAVRIGPARQAFWAVLDRHNARLHERTMIGRGAVRLQTGRVQVFDRNARIDLVLEETAGIETVSRSGASYAWTRKQGGIRARGTVLVDGRPRALDARAVIDDTAAYYERHTHWRWSAGVGVARDGRELAWNLVSGVNDPPENSERTVWIGGVAAEAAPATFADDLTQVSFGAGGAFRFMPEAVRERRENLLLIRSSYRQPFGTFSGELPGGVELAEGYGVMEVHDVWW